MTLLCFKEINNEIKYNKAEALNKSNSEVGVEISLVNSLQSEHMSSLPAGAKAAISLESSRRGDFDDRLTKKLDNMDKNAASTEVDEVQTGFVKLANLVGLNRMIQNILGQQNIIPSQDMAQAIANQDTKLAESKKLCGEIADCVKSDAVINKAIKDQLFSIEDIRAAKRSLIDDYADLSTEMPSYIEPEDC